MREAQVDGLRIAYQRTGKGPPLVLLHGFFADSRVWRRQLGDLADEFDVIAWDTPGCGRSSDPPNTFRMPDYARLLSAFIDGLRLERPHVLGLSFGSTLALELYRQKPGMCRTLVLASAYAGWSGSLPADVVEQRLRKTIPDLDLPAAAVVTIYNVPGLLTESAPRPLVDENAAIMSDFHPAGMKAMTRALAEADLRDVLPRIAVPTLLLYGDQDVRSPLNLGHDLHFQIPGSSLVVIPGAGHLSNVEAADLFNAEVRSFLRSTN
ncbi:MAG: alpha/beta hydrolase [Actinobacteria bacterium 13_1_20CM_2_65_11]|nr:MAG: alpha/beta hydrolase [Chloroflexi bacterium 13_1_40CM_65_17]OLD26892.1 MAG: alpha/beta hydrolase [Chloroflexi bacterium 13_1_40CM_3_65_12]OLD51051.1 MAG: alpha/beta hydrolase [Actinobacteria bacterium 13_1_40CM_2_65_8]OLE80369.1 MAG: alpha/beta hydrolase [Actinobacteria bacterium 13_1_20CM_2_65_11]